jgi:hypothetical protein
MAIIEAGRRARIVPLFLIRGNVMTLLLLEALGAGLLLVFIVWWTMFSGRHKGELKDDLPRSGENPVADKDPHRP